MPPVLVTGNLRVALDIFERIAGDLGVAASRHTVDYQKTIESGTGTDQADLVWSDTRTAAAGVPDTLDLRGVLSSALNGTINFVKIVGIVIRNRSTTTGAKLIVGNGANPFFSGYMAAGAHARVVGPGGIDVWYSPIDAGPTTAGTADVLQVDPGASTIVYDIAVFGRTV